MKTNSNENRKSELEYILELIEKIENNEEITQLEEDTVENWFEKARNEIRFGKNTREKSKDFTARPTDSSIIVKKAGYKIVYEQIEKFVKKIFQEF